MDDDDNDDNDNNDDNDYDNNDNPIVLSPEYDVIIQSPFMAIEEMIKLMQILMRITEI